MYFIERTLDKLKGRQHVVKQFCDGTSIHGLKFITQSDISWFERLTWAVVFLTGVAFSTYFCLQMWNKYEDSPVLMSLDSTRFLHKNTSFPAVTICNVNKISKKRLTEVLMEERFANISFSTMQKTLRYMTKLDRAITNENDLQELGQFFKSLNMSGTELFKIFNRTATTCEDLIMDCTWQGIPNMCDDFIDRLPTDDGLCCIFNGAFYNDTELELQSKNDERLEIEGNGYRMGLSMVLNADIADYSVTNGKFDGFKVLVHAREKFPDVADRGFVLNPGSETYAGIKGISSYIVDEVATKVSQRKRRCVVEGEIELRYFLRYSQSACVIECATEKMIEVCKCRPYFLRAEPNTPLCDIDQYSCISDIYEDMRRNGVDNCGCLPHCTDEWFEPEISSSTFPGYGFNLSRTYQRLVDKINHSNIVDEKEFFKSNVAILHVFYKERTGFRYKSDIRFGIEDFISAMGGLLGLGLGMSFISFIELGYFVCLRCFCKKSEKNNQRFEIKVTSLEPIPSPYHIHNGSRWRTSNTSTPSSSLAVLNVPDHNNGLHMKRKMTTAVNV